MQILTQDPMTYTFNSKGKTVEEVLQNVPNTNDKHALSVFLDLVRELAQFQQGLVPFIMADLTTEKFKTEADFAQYLLHALPVTTTNALITGHALRKGAVAGVPGAEDTLQSILKLSEQKG